MSTIDVTEQKVITARTIVSAHLAGATEILVASNCVFTPSALDSLREHNIVVSSSANVGAGFACNGVTNHGEVEHDRTAASKSVLDNSKAAAIELFNSSEAETIKAEICSVGRKLWARQYVDGNGGNISCRIGPNAVICTPTLMSKMDLQPEDLCLVDLQGTQLAGKLPRTSEVFLHLEIYKAVPEAKAAVHCHPPHATAYAITGRVPPTGIIPEFEVFVGKVALSPYETPGTPEFARTVLPFVREHNTIFLANHGIVCWGDTATHAEWSAEVVDTYCWTLMLAAQIGAPITYIPAEKVSDLLAIKKRLGMPDARFKSDPALRECQLCDLPDMPTGIAVQPPSPRPLGKAPEGQELEEIVKEVTNAVVAALQSGNS